MRLGIYTDYAYHRVEGGIYAERAFALFLNRLADELEGLTVIGRLDPRPVRARYRLSERAAFAPLPFYPRLSEPLPALRSMAGSLRRFWRALDDLDAVWLLGPHPLIFAFAAMAAVRRRRVVLGVRQRFLEYIRMRHPGNHLAYAAAIGLEHAFRRLGRRCDVVAVGPAIAGDYRRSRRLLEISVSLVHDSDLIRPQDGPRDYNGELTLLSVGRLDPEKNPLLLADVLAALRVQEPRWRLIVCGEGSMEGALAGRLRELGVSEHAELRGYLALDEGLWELYRDSHLLLHVSWTEGLPQVLFEALAAALPVVATDVGGVAGGLRGAVKLIPPGDASAAAAALMRLAGDAEMRSELVERGHRLVTTRTIDVETARTARFLRGPQSRPAPRAR